MRGQKLAVALAVFLAIAGVMHFVAPGGYDGNIPGWVPFTPRFWTNVSGIAEIGIALLVAIPRTRAAGGLLAVALFVAVFPANVEMAIDWADRPALEFALALLRLPLQIPLVWWAYRVFVNARTPAVAEPATV